MSDALRVATSHLSHTHNLSLRDHQTLRRTPGMRAMTAPLSDRHKFVTLMASCAGPFDLTLCWQGVWEGTRYELDINYKRYINGRIRCHKMVLSGLSPIPMDENDRVFTDCFGKHLMRDYETVSQLHASGLPETETTYFDVLIRMMMSQPVFKLFVEMPGVTDANDTMMLINKLQHFMSFVRGIDARKGVICRRFDADAQRYKWTCNIDNKDNMAKVKVAVKHQEKPSNRAPKPRTRLRYIATSPVAPATSPVA